MRRPPHEVRDCTVVPAGEAACDVRGGMFASIVVSGLTRVSPESDHGRSARAGRDGCARSPLSAGSGQAGTIASLGADGTDPTHVAGGISRARQQGRYPTGDTSDGSGTRAARTAPAEKGVRRIPSSTLDSTLPVTRPAGSACHRSHAGARPPGSLARSFVFAPDLASVGAPFSRSHPPAGVLACTSISSS